jgi:hypothetical protein
MDCNQHTYTSLSQEPPAMVRRFFALSSLTAMLVLVIAGMTRAEVSAERNEKGVTIKIDGKPFTEYLICSNTKPILWPVIGPTGKAITRYYPMAEVDAEKDVKKDHPHQRSFWFTHGSVNGIDFWAETTKKGPEALGSQKHREFVKVQSGKTAVVVTRNDWLKSDGTRVCEDQRTLTFGGDATQRWIDFDIVVKASDGPVTFGDTKEGSFGLRLAESMRVDAKKGGQIVNSEGQTDKDAWAKRAPWVDYHGPVEGETLGVAIMNHPSSFRFPTYWHVRVYGLFAANPFGLRDFIGEKSADGAFTLEPGQSMVLRYRVLLHPGDEKAGKVAEAYSAYAAEAK